MNLTPNEVLLIALVALLLLGPKRLPPLMRQAGQMFGNLRRWTTDVRQEVDAAISPPTPEEAASAETETETGTETETAPQSDSTE